MRGGSRRCCGRPAVAPRHRGPAPGCRPAAPPRIALRPLLSSSSVIASAAKRRSSSARAGRRASSAVCAGEAGRAAGLASTSNGGGGSAAGGGSCSVMRSVAFVRPGSAARTVTPTGENRPDCRSSYRGERLGGPAPEAIPAFRRFHPSCVDSPGTPGRPPVSRAAGVRRRSSRSQRRTCDGAGGETRPLAPRLSADRDAAVAAGARGSGGGSCRWVLGRSSRRFCSWRTTRRRGCSSPRT